MIALARMRLAGFLRGGRALAPLIAVLAVLSVIYGGGPSTAASAYGYSAVCLFPILAWLTKVLLDTEPDGQRHLARLAVGPFREGAAGLLAATVLALGVSVLAMATPWLFQGIRPPEPGSGEPPTPAGVLLGMLAHLLAVVAAVALGALAGRAVTRRVLPGVAVLATGSILTIVFGLRDSIAPWLVPPVMATARELAAVPLPGAGTFAVLAAWTVAWCAVAAGLYARLRRSRS
ncbi:hypothetical protein [Actinoplanes utahensis]|uniref:Uncharacterized protein n=1 Tax=Actinoplanes utahensis TaxID=1869 RepID=A0A0A6UHM0_ACTUT|nr:hypothetical protein [Actinoplanes utahensis]KHD73789.1 hypothetical protein MB27_32575 [Actinoplanes utahensis]GIF27849.1 hypothetical protein Aut01nite_08350 [Actinoplanes utahensis]